MHLKFISVAARVFFCVLNSKYDGINVLMHIEIYAILGVAAS